MKKLLQALLSALVYALPFVALIAFVNFLTVHVKFTTLSASVSVAVIVAFMVTWIGVLPAILRGIDRTFDF